MIELSLPYPPTINTYWRRVGARTLISKRGRQYRAEVGAIAKNGSQRLTGRLRVHIEVSPPDKRKRDIDNLPKALLDALTHAGVWVDDSQIDDLRIMRCEVSKPGKALVRIYEF